MAADGSRIEVVCLADVEVASADLVRAVELVRRAVREVVPDDWRVLPDGRSAASAIAKRYAELVEGDE